jgi:hypothetical protein
MGLFSNFFNGLLPQVEQPNDTLTGFSINIGKDGKVLSKDFLEWYKTNPFVYTAISERAKAIASCRFKIETKEGELVDNELTNKLNKPNKFLSRNEFLYQLFTYKGIWGTGYLYLNKLRPSTNVTEIDFLNIPTNQIFFGDQKLIDYRFDYILDALKFEDDNDLDVYYRGVNNVDYKPLELNNLITFFDTTVFTNPYYSQSKLESMQHVVSIIQNALESQNTLQSNPGGIGMLVPDTKDASGVAVTMRDEEKEKVEKQLQEDYGTLDGQRNIRILNSPVKYIDTMVDASKLKFSDTLIQSALVLFGAYGLPKELLTAMMKGATFENQKIAYKNYIQNTAQFEADSVANSLDEEFPSSEGKLVADFSHLPIMQEDEAEKATKDKTKAEALKINKEVYDDLLNRGMVTEEEYKKKLGL